jgi:hypothetical protein
MALRTNGIGSAVAASAAFRNILRRVTVVFSTLSPLAQTSRINH